MTLKNQMIALLGLFFLYLWHVREFISGLEVYQLNTSAYKKRVKGQTIKEWFFYTRFRDVIPPIFIAIYFGVIIGHLLILVVCIILYYITDQYHTIGRKIVIGVYIWNLVWGGVLHILFWQPKKREYKYERWIEKKRGQKKK